MLELEAILIGAVIAIASIILLIILIGAIKGIKKNRKKKEEVVEETTDLQPEVMVNSVAEEKVEPIKIVLAQGEGIYFGSEGRLPCGEYTIETCDGEETVKMRVGRYVKTYANGDKVLFTEKQKVTPVSGSIILR